MSRVLRQVMTGLVSIVRRTSELLLTASREEASVRGVRRVRGEQPQRVSGAERLRLTLRDDPRRRSDSLPSSPHRPI